METSRILSQEKGEKNHHSRLDRVFPCGSAVKESACNVGDLAWEDPLEKGKVTHFSILAWRIP